jgi:hypothetical protein
MALVPKLPHSENAIWTPSGLGAILYVPHSNSSCHHQATQQGTGDLTRNNVLGARVLMKAQLDRTATKREPTGSAAGEVEPTSYPLVDGT